MKQESRARQARFPGHFRLPQKEAKRFIVKEFESKLVFMRANAIFAPLILEKSNS
jgi:hypothetical protein